MRDPQPAVPKKRSGAPPNSLMAAFSDKQPIFSGNSVLPFLHAKLFCPFLRRLLLVLIPLLIPSVLLAGVNPLTGLYETKEVDLFVQFQSVQVEVSRSWINQKAGNDKDYPWTFLPFQKRIVQGHTAEELIVEDGEQKIVFEHSSPENRFFSVSQEPILIDDGQYQWTKRNGMVEVYAQDGRLSMIQYPDGKILQINSKSIELQIPGVESIPLLKVTYNSQSQITGFRAYNGVSSSYFYNSDGLLESATNGDNLTTHYEYDEQGRLSRITYQTGDFVNVSYDQASGLVKAVENKKGVTTYSFVRGKIGLITKTLVEGPAGIHQTEVLPDDSGGTIVRSTDPAGNVTEETYTPKGLLASYKDAKGHTVSYAYDDLNRLSTIFYPDQSSVTYTYWRETSLIAKTVLPNGGAIHQSYNDHQQLIKVTGPGEIETSYSYNEMGLPHTILQGKDKKRATTLEYDERGFLSTHRDALGRTTRFQRDQQGRLTTLIDPLGRKQQFHYNRFGLLEKVLQSSQPVFSRTYDDQLRITKVTDARGLITFFHYDPQGKLQTITYPKGTKERFEYAQNGELAAVVDHSGERIKLNPDHDDGPISAEGTMIAAPKRQYDPFGNLIKETAPDGSSTQWQYDPMDRLQSILFPAGGKQEYQYDQSGSLISEIDVQGNQKHYHYDQTGNLIKVVLPNGEETAYDLDPQGTGSVIAAHTSDGRTYRYEYDLGGRLIQTTTPWGERILYTYDSADRLTQRSSSSGTTISYFYDDFDRMTKVVTSDEGEQEFTYDAKGDLIAIKGPQFEKQLTYNAFGELVSEKYPLLGKTIHYTYDQAGNRISLEVPGQLKLTYAYDAGNRLTKISYGPNQTIILSYDAQNRKKEVVYPNGVSISYDYNSLKLLHQITFTNQQGKEIQHQQYEYDDLKRVSKITDSEGITRQFQYDANGQLLQAVLGDQEKTFKYAPSFKRLEERQGDKVRPYRYNKAGQLIGQADLSIHYDGSGNVERMTGSEEEKQFSFNANGMLTKIQTPTGLLSYTYSPEGKRIAKQVGQTKTSYLYDGENLLFVLDKDNKPIQTFIHDDVIDSPLVMLRKEEAYYFLPDQQGSTIGLIDAQGKVTTRYEYGPFGDIIKTGKETGNPLTYTGRFFDGESGLYYYRSRYYNPHLGVFLSPDSYPKAFEFPETFNDYAYVQNDPMNLIDPLGLAGLATGFRNLGAAPPRFLSPTFIPGEHLTSPSFWERMANDYEFLRKNFGPGTAEKFRKQLNDAIKGMLPQRQPPKPGILSRAWDAGKGLINRIGGGAKKAGEGLQNIFRRPPSPTRVGNISPRGGQSTLMANGPRPIGQLNPSVPGGGNSTGFSPLTEGKSSFQKPSILTRLNQPVSGMDVGGGILGAVLIGYDVGSQYAEQARREGRSVTAGEYAQSAAWSATRAVGAVLTAGGSEAAILVNRAREERNARNAAQAEQTQAEETARQTQRQAADKILAFAQQATALVGEARQFKKDQDNAIQQAKAQYESAQGKLALLEGFQTPADFNAECRTCQAKIDQLIRLKADAEGYKDPLTKNRDLAKERRVLVCQDPYQPDASSHVQMASGAASLAQGNVQAIQRFASQAPTLQSEITQCLASIEANTTALMDLQATSGRVDTIITEISSLADQARAFGGEARSFQGKCQQLQGRMARIDNIAKATPDQIVIQIGGIDGPAEIIPTTGAKATIANAVGDIKSTCDQISADATKGDTYGNYADAIAQSAKEKAGDYKAKLEAQTVHACTAGPLPQGIADDLQAMAGAAEVLASYATTDAGEAQRCLAKAQQAPPSDQPPSEGSQTGDDLLAGFPDAPGDSPPADDDPITPEQAEAVEGFDESGHTSHLPPSDPDKMVSGDSSDTPPVDIAAVAQAERDKDEARNRDQEGIQRDEDRQANEEVQTINQQNAQDRQTQDAAAQQGVTQAQAQGQVMIDQANQTADPIMSGHDMGEAIDKIQQEGKDKIQTIDDKIRQGLGGTGQGGGGSTRQPLPPPPSMGTGPVDTAVIQCNTKYGSGGDNPGFFTIDFSGATGVAQFEYSMANIKDEMEVSVGGPSFNTTCRSGGEKVPITIPSPNAPVTVTVKPNCACKKPKCTGTIWSFTFYCPTSAGAPTSGPAQPGIPQGGIFGQ